MYSCIKLHGRIAYALRLLTNEEVQDEKTPSANTRLSSADYTSRQKRQVEVTTITRAAYSLRERISNTLENPSYSKIAMWYNRLTLFMVLGSIVLFYSQTVPELHHYGKESRLCQMVVRDYCENDGEKYSDPGCMSRNTDVLGQALIFDCPTSTTSTTSSTNSTNSTSTCYGVGRNFGSSDLDSPDCIDAFSPEGIKAVCNRRQCNDEHQMMFDGAQWWPSLEWIFGLWLTGELLLRLAVAPKRRLFFKSPYNVIDAVSLLPFVAEVYEVIVLGNTPSYAVVASDTSIFSFIEMSKTIRVLRLTRVSKPSVDRSSKAASPHSVVSNANNNLCSTSQVLLCSLERFN